MAAIGLDATHFRGRQEHVLRTLLGEEALDLSLPPQIELTVRAQQQTGCAVAAQPAHDGGTYEPVVAGHID
jgi:hypothetical protein